MKEVDFRVHLCQVQAVVGKEKEGGRKFPSPSALLCVCFHFTHARNKTNLLPPPAKAKEETSLVIIIVYACELISQKLYLPRVHF